MTEGLRAPDLPEIGLISHILATGEPSPGVKVGPRRQAFANFVVQLLGHPLMAGLSSVVERRLWSELDAIEGVDGQIGIVTDDAGVHDDPVNAEGDVPNTGRYRYSADPAGWERTGDYAAIEVATLLEQLAGVITGKASDPAGVVAVIADRLQSVYGLSTETYPGTLLAWVDALYRIALRLRDDGAVEVGRLVDAQGRDVIARLDETRAIADAASIGSTFRNTMVQAQIDFGRYPKPWMASPPTLTLSAGDTVAGTELLSWNSPAFKAYGGTYSNYGGNPVGFFFGCRRFGGAGDLSSNTNHAALEFVHTGDICYVLLRGSGASVRVLVNNQYVTKTLTTTAPDGNYHKLAIDFGGVSATRDIRVEGTGNLQIRGLRYPTGQSITAPAKTRPKIALAGTSITEAPGWGWGRWLEHRLGVDAHNVAVGGAGIFATGTAPRVKQIDRIADLTAPAFLMCLDENGHNDSSSGFYTDTSAATVIREFGDAYRAVLDAWFAAHPDAPWIALAPWWENSGAPAILYHIRDAKQRVVSEYPLGAFIDTLTPLTLMQGSRPSGIAPATDYIGGDNVHPVENGNEMIGLHYGDRIDTLIRTRF